MNIQHPQIESLLNIAIEEDLGSGDITSNACIDKSLVAKARIIAKQDFVVCGQLMASAVFNRISDDIVYNIVCEDGSSVLTGQVIAELKGNYRGILSGERTALNFLQRLSAISTLANQAKALVEDLKVEIVDTRKTTPGWRILEKYAVKNGGGANHRIGLFDAVLIKNNHIDALGGDVCEAVKLCKNSVEKDIFVQVEVRNQGELQSAISASPNSILLDNMSLEQLRQSVSKVRSSESKISILLEASGGVKLDNLREIAETGVDRISMGSITHSAQAVDISLRFEES